jgi:DNA-binding winged helix-turn-helix (wHTH) protein
LNSRLKPLYEFGSFKIDAARRLLLRDGAPVVLTAKAFDLLLLLVERGGEVVSKDELMQILWPSTVVIEANLTQQVAMVRRALGEAGHRYVMTHPGRGYSLAEPVHVISVPDAHDRAEPEPAPLLQDRRGRLDDEAVAATAEQRTPAGGVHSERWLPRWARVGLPPILGVIAVLVWVWLRHPPSPPPSASRGPSHPSMLAVLPFQNLSNDPEQEYVSDGLTEETIADLGELSPQRLGVIARTSAMTYKHSSKSVTQIGNELGVVQMRKALELDPLSPIYNTVTGLTYYLEARLREPQFFSHVHQGGSGLRLVTLRPALREFDKVNGLVTYKMTEQFDEFPDAQLRPVS